MSRTGNYSKPFGVLAKLNRQTSRNSWHVNIAGLFLDYNIIIRLHKIAIKCFTHLVVCELWRHTYIYRMFYVLRLILTGTFKTLLLLEITRMIFHLSKSTIGVYLSSSGCFTFTGTSQDTNGPIRFCILSSETVKRLKVIALNWMCLHQ